MTLNKTYNLSGPQFPHLSNGDGVKWELNEMIQGKCLAHSEHSGAAHITDPEKPDPGCQFWAHEWIGHGRVILGSG